MNVTALFVELLVVGIGTAMWLTLFVAGIFKYKFDANLFQENPALTGTLVAIVYVLGVVVDRVIRGIFMPTLEKKAKRGVFTKAITGHILKIAPYIREDNLSMELEKFIRTKSDVLASKIDYNRSRLRICRAWVVHFVLIAASLTWWHFRVSIVGLDTYLWLVGADILFLVLTWRTTYLLTRDHQKDLEESFRIVTKSAAGLAATVK